MSQSGEFNLVENDLFIRLQRKVGLAPQNHLGVVRRALFFSLFCWAPIMIWAIFSNRLIEAKSAEPVLQQFAIHTYCLISIPCLILSETYTLQIVKNILSQFISCEMVSKTDQNKFATILLKISSLRDQTLPWILIIGISIAWIGAIPADLAFQELSWAQDHEFLSFGGIWFLYVVRPIFIALLLAWLWRLALVILLFHRISSIKLQFVPTHPDRLGGIGFIQNLTDSFALITFAISALLATKWAHEILFHEASFESFKVPMIAFLLIVALFFTLPNLFFIPQLLRCKKTGMKEYRALTARYGRLLHQRWIENQPNTSALLEAQELGPLADVNGIFESVEKMRIIPVNLKAMLGIILAALLPMLLVAATEIPIKDILLKLLKAIV